MFVFTYMLCTGFVSLWHDLPQPRLSDTEYMFSWLVGSSHSYAPRFSQARIAQTH